MKIFVCFLGIAFSSVAQDESKPPVTKLEFILASPNLSANSIGAKPKTIYLAGKTYARIEQPADVTSERQNLIIVHEPDVWIVDIAGLKGRHAVSPGPDFEVHNPILGPDGPPEFSELEYGHEPEFFRRPEAKTLQSKRIGTAKCEVKELKANHYRITLYTDSVKKCPVLLQVFHGEEVIVQIVYLSYETGLAFNPSLFQPPKAISFVEAVE